MASQSKGKGPEIVIERPGFNWRENLNSEEASSLILSVVNEAAVLAPIAELKKAACTALVIFKTTQILKEKEAHEQLGYDSGGLIVAIWRSFKKAEDPEEWLSAEMRDILEDLLCALENIYSFVDQQSSKSKAIRVIFRRADAVKIDEYREHLDYVMQKFELQSRTNRSMELASKENNRINNKTRAPSSEKKSSTREDKVYEEGDERWEGNFVAEEEEARELERPVRRSAKVSRSPKRRRVRVDTTDDEDGNLQSLRSSRLRASRRKLPSASLPEEEFMFLRSAKARKARQNLSSASLRVQDKEDEYSATDEENNYAPSAPRRSPKAKRMPQTSSGDVDDFMTEFQGFAPMGLGNPHRSLGSPIYVATMNSNPSFPTHDDSFASPIGPFGYGVRMSGSIVNSGLENVVNSSISNVGNDNSVKKVYSTNTSHAISHPNSRRLRTICGTGRPPPTVASAQQERGRSRLRSLEAPIQPIIPPRNSPPESTLITTFSHSRRIIKKGKTADDSHPVPDSTPHIHTSTEPLQTYGPGSSTDPVLPSTKTTSTTNLPEAPSPAQILLEHLTIQLETILLTLNILLQNNPDISHMDISHTKRVLLQLNDLLNLNPGATTSGKPHNT